MKQSKCTQHFWDLASRRNPMSGEIQFFNQCQLCGKKNFSRGGSAMSDRDMFAESFEARTYRKTPTRSKGESKSRTDAKKRRFQKLQTAQKNIGAEEFGADSYQDETNYVLIHGEKDGETVSKGHQLGITEKDGFTPNTITTFDYNPRGGLGTSRLLNFDGRVETIDPNFVNRYHRSQRYRGEEFGAEYEVLISDNNMDFGLLDSSFEDENVALEKAWKLSQDETEMFVYVRRNDGKVIRVFRPNLGRGAEEFGAEGNRFPYPEAQVTNIVRVKDKAYVTIRYPDTDEHYGYEKIMEVDMEDVMLAESFEAEVCPCGCAMKGCVCSSSCKGECLGAEEFGADVVQDVKDFDVVGTAQDVVGKTGLKIPTGVASLAVVWVAYMTGKRYGN